MYGCIMEMSQCADRCEVLSHERENICAGHELTMWPLHAIFNNHAHQIIAQYCFSSVIESRPPATSHEHRMKIVVNNYKHCESFSIISVIIYKRRDQSHPTVVVTPRLIPHPPQALITAMGNSQVNELFLAFPCSIFYRFWLHQLRIFNFCPLHSCSSTIYQLISHDWRCQDRLQLIIRQQTTNFSILFVSITIKKTKTAIVKRSKNVYGRERCGISLIIFFLFKMIRFIAFSISLTSFINNLKKYTFNTKIALKTIS